MGVYAPDCKKDFDVYGTFLKCVTKYYGKDVELGPNYICISPVTSVWNRDDYVQMRTTKRSLVR